MHPNFTKVIEPCPYLFCEITWKNGKLSIHGVDRPRKKGGCGGSCGQIYEEVLERGSNPENLMPGWTTGHIARLVEAWKLWHLNDLTARSPAQEQALGENREYRNNHMSFDDRCAYLAELGLQPDEDYIYNGKPYEYGTAWFKKAVPTKVIIFLANLPESQHIPAWV